MTRYFEYGEEEVAYLKARDAKLAAAIDAVGHVNREMMDEGDLFAAVVHHIIGQQISSAAQATVWARLREALGEVTPASVCDATPEQLQSCGTTFKKVGYIKNFAEQVQSGEFDLTFQCKPQRFLKSGEKIIKFEGDTTFENTDAIYNPTPFASKPMIHIVRKTEGVGVTLNIGVGFVDINAVCPYGDIIIDCERMDAYTGPTVEDTVSVNPYILMDSFPEIDPGKNEVWRNNIDYVEIIPRWWVL